MLYLVGVCLAVPAVYGQSLSTDRCHLAKAEGEGCYFIGIHNILFRMMVDYSVTGRTENP